MKREYALGVMLLLGILLVGFVLASDPTWEEAAYNVSHYFNEDSVYYYNFTDNLTDFSQLQHISVLDISWTEDGTKTSHSDFPWLSWNDSGFANSTTGVMKINSTANDETGNFTINVFAQGITTGQSAKFSFIINATNDAPVFTNIDSEYNLSYAENFLDYINASDEEEQYPLYFNISFFNNCTHAVGSTRTNCSLFSLEEKTNTSSMMNFTPTLNDVGTYWANITVADAGEDYPCPHAYCVNSTYMQNKTTSSIVQFNVFSSLVIDATDCLNKIFQENESGACEINITTKGETDSLDIYSQGALRNYAGSVPNSTWFYYENLTTGSNFALTAYVNVTPQKTEVGNWTINFTVEDSTFGDSASELIYVYVNRTNNDVPDLVDIANQQTSVNLDTTIDLAVYDDDLLIPDKEDGYNETISFDVKVLNQSNLAQELSLNNFDAIILHMPVGGTNRTEAKIEFTPEVSEAGNYTINVTVNDLDGSIDSDLFNLSIISNQFPVWNQTVYDFDLVVNSSFATTAGFGPINLTGDYYVNDTGDTLTFTNSSSAMPSFSLSSGGIISFTPYKQDVGSWNFTVTATDSLGLQNQTTFRFNITNINSNPVIRAPLQPINATVDVNSNVNAQEDNYTVLTLFIQDEDFIILDDKKDYYNESLVFNLTIEGNNTNLFSFVKDPNFPASGSNQSNYIATFTPNSTDVGSYNITINVTDASGASDTLIFNLTIISTNDAPTLISLTNYTTAVNRTLYYDINASDEEDGNDSEGNLSFSYEFLTGADIFNSTTFNSTTGVLNITFNSSQGGKYEINVTVNDTSNSMDSKIFWINVYDVPNITSPSLGENFSLQENSTSNLTFSGNHSIQDNLTYEFYINNTLKYNVTYLGNDTNLTWSFTPGFSDETYGNNQNLTLVVYPANSDLENRTDLNYTINWNVNISHANAPVAFSGHIGDSQANYDQNIQINLSQYFSDADYSDENYNQTINFTIESDSSPSYISSSVSSNWILTLSSLIAVTEVLNVTANDSATSATSNGFQIQFTTPSTTTVTTPTTGGSSGGTTQVPVSLKIIVPNVLSAYQKDRIVLPLTLYNNGKTSLSGITLSSTVVKNNILRNDIIASFDKNYFPTLAIGQKEELNMTLDVNTEENGTFEITINASVANPQYHDWAKIYLTIKEANSSLLDRLVFTQEFLQENPECIELEELLNEARAYFASGDFFNTIIKIQEAINGCKNAISQEARIKRKEPTENKLYRYLFITTIVLFFLGLGYYSYKRMKLKRSSGDYFVKERNKNFVNRKAYSALMILLGVSIIFLFPIKTNILGFTIKDSISSNTGIWIPVFFVLILGILGTLLLLRRKKKMKKIQEGLYVRNKSKYFK